MQTSKKSNYARKSEFLKAYNRKAEKDPGAAKGARVWGFDFAEKPWRAAS